MTAPRAGGGAASSRQRTRERLRVTEVFHSLQGESTRAGLPTTFVRLTGCPLRCSYCDSAYAFHGGRSMSLEAVYRAVARWPARHVTVTGGEPLAQAATPALLTGLADRGYSVSLETGGALDTAAVDPRVSIVLDLKTPGSGESARNRAANVDRLRPHDEVKFVLCDRRDYLWAREQVVALGLPGRCEVLFSPADGRLDAARLAEWILADGLGVRLQLQLHKLLWGDVPGR